jgi:hypothetical protein
MPTVYDETLYVVINFLVGTSRYGSQIFYE